MHVSRLTCECVLIYRWGFCSFQVRAKAAETVHRIRTVKLGHQELAEYGALLYDVGQELDHLAPWVQAWNTGKARQLHSTGQSSPGKTVTDGVRAESEPIRLARRLETVIFGAAETDARAEAASGDEIASCVEALEDFVREVLCPVLVQDIRVLGIRAVRKGLLESLLMPLQREA